MEITKTPIEGLIVLAPRIFTDSRGHFFESFNLNFFKEHGIDFSPRQANQSSSSINVIRGLHFQSGSHAQSKLVRVLQGKVFDVAVDVRKHSPTYGKWFGIELSADNKKQLFIPKGFAHGFSVLSHNTIVSYMCDQFYNPTSEGGIRYDDSELNIDWRVAKGKEIISDKDLELPSFNTIEGFDMRVLGLAS